MAPSGSRKAVPPEQKSLLVPLAMCSGLGGKQWGKPIRVLPREEEYSLPQGGDHQPAGCGRLMPCPSLTPHCFAIPCSARGSTASGCGGLCRKSFRGPLGSETAWISREASVCVMFTLRSKASPEEMWTAGAKTAAILWGRKIWCYNRYKKAFNGSGLLSSLQALTPNHSTSVLASSQEAGQ